MRRPSLPPAFVLKYYLFRASRAASFTAPIWYLYVLDSGVGYAQLGVLDAIWWGGLLLFEVPTGYLGDRLGRRVSLVVSGVGATACLVGMTVASSFAQFAVVFGAWAVFQTFRSGSGDAWLYDALRARADEATFARVKGRGSSIALVVSGTTAFLGGVVAEASMAHAYLASAAVTALSVPVVLSLPAATPGRTGDGTTVGTHATDDDPASDDDGGEDSVGEDDGGEDDRFTVLDALPVLRSTFSRPPLRSFVAYAGLFAGVFWGVNFFVQPVARGLGFDATGLGALYASFTFLGAGVSYFAGAIEDRVGVERWFETVPLALGAGFVLVALVPTLAIPMFVLVRALRSTHVSLRNAFINRHVGSVGRATALSAAGMAFHALTIPFELAAGVLAGATAPLTVVGLYGAILVGGGGTILILGDPFGHDVDGAGAPAGAAAPTTD